MSWTATKGYVIDANEECWLLRYKSPWQSPRDCKGEPTHFDHQALQHGEVSTLLKARFAVWAYTMVPQARDKCREPNEFANAMRSADLHGRVLATVLRSEIGPGPAIIYADHFPAKYGGPIRWRVTDEGKLVPYWHQPSAGYVVTYQDYGAWAFEFRPAAESMLGESVGFGPVWFGEQPIGRELVEALTRWSAQWSAVKCKPKDALRQFDWDAYNSQGLELTRRLKQALGVRYRVFYMRLPDEPIAADAWKVLDLAADGSNRPYVHARYWADDVAARAQDLKGDRHEHR